LGRYTHRAAIANSRTIGLGDGVVGFKWRDCRHPGVPKVMRLPAVESIRRLMVHSLSGGRKIRQYDILAGIPGFPRRRRLGRQWKTRDGQARERADCWGMPGL
jgi:hypothetical protein